MGSIGRDVRFAVRLLSKSPAVSALAVIALALGIGANTAIFSLVNATLLRSLPGVADPDRLVQLERLQHGQSFYNFGNPDYLDYQERTRTLEGLAAHVPAPLSFAADSTERIRGELVTGNYFSLLGVTPSLGRLIDDNDTRGPGKHAVAVLGFTFWRRAFGADPNAVGKAINLNGYSFIVVGVADKDFGGTRLGSSVDVWLPISMLAEGMPRTRSDGSDWFGERAWGWISLFGRLKPGITIAQAGSEMKALAQALEREHPETNEGRSVRVVDGFGLDSDDREEMGTLLGLLLSAVGVLLLISCSNVATLLLVRGAGRRREMAVRLALGAGRTRLIRQLLTEGVLLSLPAGALGLMLAPWVSGAVVAFQQSSSLLRGADVVVDLRVLAFTLALSIATGILFGLAPAFQASKTDLVSSLKDGAAASRTRRSWLQSGLAVFQVALSLVLLIGAGLLVKTMRTVLATDPGFTTDDLLLMSVDLTVQGYTEEEGLHFYDQVRSRIETIPGVVSASLAKTVPPNSWSDRAAVFNEGEEPPQDVLRGRDDLGLRVELNRIAPEYFRTLGVVLLQGREFSDDDRDNRHAVAIVNEMLARRIWPDQSPIGKRLSAPTLSGPARPPVEVIGLVRDTRHRSLLSEPPMILYLPEQQSYDGRATIVIRTQSDPRDFMQPVRKEIAAIDKNLPLFGVQTMADQISSTLWQQRMAAGLIGILGLLALLMAAVGIYGVVAQLAAQRTREIAIRMALGAEPIQVFKLIASQGAMLALMGIGAGLAAALAGTRVLSSLLWGVSATDPAVFVGASLLLAIVPFLASLAPARRASRINPVTALRQQ